MQTHLECIPCMIRQTLFTLNLATTDDALKKKAMGQVLDYLARLDYALSPPEHGAYLYNLIYRITGNDDPYRNLKKQYNQILLKEYESIKRLTRKYPSPFTAAAKLAAAGNIIDFGPSDKHIPVKAILDGLQEEWAIDDSARFVNDLATAQEIVYLADNAGEIVLDRLFIETIKETFAGAKLNFTVVVRGAPVINDATIEDARQVGLFSLGRVIGNGDNTPGTVMKAVSEEVRRLMERADMIIAKGMGNFETLTDYKRKIYFLLRVKCAPVARLAGTKPGQLVFSAGINRPS